MIDDFVFCPKCGKKNVFAIEKTSEKIDYYCAYCHAWLNFYWNDYLKGTISLFICEYCQQETFEHGKFCISCGFLQKDYKPRYVKKDKKIDTSPLNVIIVIAAIPLGLAVFLTIILYSLCCYT